MKINFHKNFKKKLKKISPKIQNKFYKRLQIFIKDKNNKILHNHSVDKTFTDCRSINVTGDYRAIFKEDGNTIVFANVGTHSELY
jgi:addiction module RelE/StbE family toxin